MNERLKALSAIGVSIWLDDLSRERLDTGNLARLVAEQGVTGVTTNPTIFAAAVAKGSWYDAQLAEFTGGDTDVEQAVLELTTTDVRRACDLLYETFVSSGGVDGRVSIEVSPRLAFDTEATVRSAEQLWTTVDRPNLLIKVPATDAGLPAITEILGRGKSVNVTLIFGLDRYRGVMEAYLDGLELAAQRGHDLASIHSVASFFVSRVDTEVDKRLERLGAPDNLKGCAAVANARLAYASYREMFSGERFAQLSHYGARVQRPLWASTGVKDAGYSDTMYVTDLAVADTVNTMPEKTLRAVADHGVLKGDQMTGRSGEALQVLTALADAGIHYDDVIATLEREGIERFIASWDELVDMVRAGIRRAQFVHAPSSTSPARVALAPARW